jgi:hypothetical protein
MQLHLIRKGTFTESEIEKLGLEPVGAGQPDNPPVKL